MSVRGVLNLKTITAEQMAALTEENAVYIGRPQPRWKGRKAAPPGPWLLEQVHRGSPWANPFPVLLPERMAEQVVDDYADWLGGRAETWKARLSRLQGKWFLCWCSSPVLPAECHGHPLAAAVDGKRWVRGERGK